MGQIRSCEYIILPKNWTDHVPPSVECETSADHVPLSVECENDRRVGFDVDTRPVEFFKAEQSLSIVDVDW